MAMAGFILLSLLSAAAMDLSAAAAAETYHVGDADGWTIGPNYEKWASSKTFSVGDTIVFKYDNGIHNAIEVTKEGYDDCTVRGTAAINGYTTGNDEVALKSNGHRYFICGIPGHCQAGQKVDIPVGVSSGSSSAAGAPAAAAGPGIQTTEGAVGSVVGVSASAAAGNTAGIMKGLGFAMTVLTVVSLFIVAA